MNALLRIIECVAYFASHDSHSSCILDEILELARDEESQVRQAAFDALLNMASLIDDGKYDKLRYTLSTLTYQVYKPQ